MQFVLKIILTDIARDCARWIAAIEHHLKKRNDIRFVALGCAVHLCLSPVLQ